jgi:RNA polymerase sigma-70 factor (ECF subfamily)
MRPDEWLEQRARLDALSRAIRELTDRQREVFVAVALNDIPIDVVAVKLGTNRNAVYKNLFDARRRLRAAMAAAGHPVSDGRGRDIVPNRYAALRSAAERSR